MNYYNENDPKAVAWLRVLIVEGLIPAGWIDSRSIVEVAKDPDSIAGYTQHHFFAGIGGWALALQLAGWPEDEPVATASCPCQPFSQSGLGLAELDPRHLWPCFHTIATRRKFPVVFGEQVASKAGRKWLTGVRADMEALAYEFGAADLCAAGVSAPHRRQRLYWVANTTCERWGKGRGQYREVPSAGRREFESPQHGSISALADTNGGNGSARWQQRSGEHRQQPQDSRVGPLVLAERAGLEGLAGHGDNERQPGRFHSLPNGSTAETGIARYWDAFDLLHCTDGKARRIEPGSSPLAHGVPARMGRLRGYGNAIVPELAAEFIQACEGARFLADLIG